MTKLPIMLLASVFIVACGSDEKDPTPTPATTWYADTDLDTYGNPAVTQSAVDQPSGYVADNTDCDDDDMDVNPGQTEINDDKDNNCDGTINDGPYSVGDRGPAGGWVFIATSPFHGLEAAPVNQGGSGTTWGCPGTLIASGNGAEGLEVGTGYLNTLAILQDCADSGIAAKLADAYTLNGFDDWFLPSQNELNALYTMWNTHVVGGFGSGHFWSSSENGVNGAWDQHFGDGFQDSNYKGYTVSVRAVRAF